MVIKPQMIALKIAEKLREIATRQGNVPFDKGDLRKSHIVEPHGVGGAILSANTPYARAVHDGRPKLVIKPKRGKALSWKGARHPVRQVTQKARKGNPWMRRAVNELQREGLSFLTADIGTSAVHDLEETLKKSGLTINKKG